MRARGLDATGIVTLTITLKNCQTATHAFHLHMTNMCSNDAADAGPHWSPKGEMLGVIMCGGGMGGTGTATYKTPSKGYWTLGTNDVTSDILMHALVFDQGDETKPASTKSPSPCNRTGPLWRQTGKQSRPLSIRQCVTVHIDH
ncbi:MAG: hypothetical protein JWM82_3684 [Myxococcales bacterium]|nr:hypothetical protein [Myxococcales bacterium]